MNKELWGKIREKGKLRFILSEGIALVITGATVAVLTYIALDKIFKHGFRLDLYCLLGITFLSIRFLGNLFVWNYYEKKYSLNK